MASIAVALYGRPDAIEHVHAESYNAREDCAAHDVETLVNRALKRAISEVEQS